MFETNLDRYDARQVRRAQGAARAGGLPWTLAPASEVASTDGLSHLRVGLGGGLSGGRMCLGSVGGLDGGRLGLGGVGEPACDGRGGAVTSAVSSAAFDVRSVYAARHPATPPSIAGNLAGDVGGGFDGDLGTPGSYAGT
jgi:hypothetical protein